LFSTIRFFFGCGTVLFIAMILLAHLPKSPLRTALTQICGWATAGLCGAYVLSPFDVAPEALLGPFGLIDDLIAAIIGFMSARAAWKAGKEKSAADAEQARAA
jgi:uncharacterized membrane protein YkvA (DUF1232 family)